MNLKNPGRKTATALCAAENNDLGRTCVALNAVDGTVPEWAEIIPAGPLVQGLDGRNWIMNDAQAVVNASNALVQSGQGAPLDEGHKTQISYNGEAPACGWFEEYRLGKSGSIEARIDWTELGRGFVSRREYRFISAAFDYDYDTREIQVNIGGGLVNGHNLRVAALNKKTNHTEENMDSKLMAALGIIPSGDPAKDLATALNKILTLQNEHTTALNAQKDLVPRADLETALSGKKELQGKLDQIGADAFSAKVETAVNAAVTAGKVIPATKQYHLDTIKDPTALNAFETTYGKAPKVVDGKEVVSGGEPEADTALNAAEKELGDVFGNSAEDLKKYGGES